MKTVECGNCYEEVPADEATVAQSEYGEVELCEKCINNETETCVGCDETFLTKDLEDYGSGLCCRKCYENGNLTAHENREAELAGEEKWEAKDDR
jgi:hypothetical protein